MPTLSYRAFVRLALLLVGLALLVTAGCGSLGPALPRATAEPAGSAGFITPAGSVQDQLAQLAAGAAPTGTPIAGVASAAPTSSVLVVHSPTAAPSAAAAQPTVTRTRRPTATQVATTRATRTPTPAVQPSRAPRGTRTPADGLPTISLAKLPPEARRTIELIQQGGPFPYDKDGATFGNREGRLPKRPNGYYREYTVITPGSPDRGARRIIAGQAGEFYYTADHYDTFKRVILP